jgi:uncharacterized membrane protein YdjX (TVP38/TMEM64 family)
VQRKPRLRRIHSLLQRRGFAAVLAVRLMPAVPTGGLHYAAGASPVGVRAFGGAIAIGALLRTVPYAVLGQGLASGSVATMLVAAVSIVVGTFVAALLFRQLRRAGVRRCLTKPLRLGRRQASRHREAVDEWASGATGTRLMSGP